MAHLYLHIGTPKAGSSSIQNFLLQEGPGSPIEYIDSCGGLCGHKFLSVPSFRGQVAPEIEARIPRKYRLSGLQDIAWDQIEAEIRDKAASGRPFFISEEHFYMVYDKDSVAIAALAARLRSLFDTVTILVYLRDQRAYVKSLYSQLVKRGRTVQSFGQYVNSADRLRDLVDYATRLDLWGTAFGQSNIQAVHFDRAAFPEGNVLLDLLARLGVDDPALRDRARAFRKQNVSPTYVQMELIRHATRLGLNSKMRRRWINNRHMRRLSDATLPDTWDDLILNFSARGNAYVNRTYLTDAAPGLPVCPAEEERDPG